jgi:hypothetical protein
MQPSPLGPSPLNARALGVHDVERKAGFAHGIGDSSLAAVLGFVLAEVATLARFQFL